MVSRDFDLGPPTKFQSREIDLNKAILDLKDSVYVIIHKYSLTSRELNYIILDYLRGFSRDLLDIELRQQEKHNEVP